MNIHASEKDLSMTYFLAAAGLPAFAAIPVYIYFTGEIPAFETKIFPAMSFSCFL
ncbi:MAG: hypothetical protein ACLTM8_00465 [Veillonella parvula]